MFYWFYGLLFLTAATTYGQNLVLNPSFEEGASCDGESERIDTIPDWSFIAGKIGYINTNCPLSKESKLFVQAMRLPPASEGNVLSVQRFDEKGEFHQGRLKETLKKGQQYLVSMRVRRPIKFCQHPIKEVGVVLSAEPLETSVERRSIELPALSLQNNRKTLLESQYDWEEISALYEAKGDEQFIAIGNFLGMNQAELDQQTGKACSYLFIDVVQVQVFKEITLEAYKNEMALKKNQRLLLKEVGFETAENLNSLQGQTQLKALAEQLKAYPKLKIELSVHLDNSMDATKSLMITKQQADIIKEYLMKEEVPAQQIEVLGIGSSQPIALNSDVKGRAKNKRVELRVLNL